MPNRQTDRTDDESTGSRPAPTQARVRDAIRSVGGSVGAGRLATHPTALIARPFGSAEPVEHPQVRAVPVEPAAPPADVGFLDGIQRYALEGHFGLAPVVRAYVAAAVLTRRNGTLKPAVPPLQEDFLVAPLSQLSAAERRALEELGLPVRESAAEPRAHPLLDVQKAVEEVERSRERLEHAVAGTFTRTVPGGWLVVDGSVTGVASLSAQVVGIVKSHETQFLEGADLRVALTLPYGHRTSIFSRTTAGRGSQAHTWYLRLWPREEHDLLHGLVRIERSAEAGTSSIEADTLSGWLLSERTPLSSSDGRWDRLLYPIHMVENFLRAKAGGWV
jgi:hypothetical protein